MVRIPSGLTGPSSGRLPSPANKVWSVPSTTGHYVSWMRTRAASRPDRRRPPRATHRTCSLAIRVPSTQSAGRQARAAGGAKTTEEGLAPEASCTLCAGCRRCESTEGARRRLTPIAAPRHGRRCMTPTPATSPSTCDDSWRIPTRPRISCKRPTCEQCAQSAERVVVAARQCKWARGATLRERAARLDHDHV